MLDEFNKVSPNLEFKLEQEHKDTLHLLDIKIDRCNAESEWQFRFSLYK
jgi:hypothetical protein